MRCLAPAHESPAGSKGDRRRTPAVHLKQWRATSSGSSRDRTRFRSHQTLVAPALPPHAARDGAAKDGEPSETQRSDRVSVHTRCGWRRTCQNSSCFSCSSLRRPIRERRSRDRRSRVCTRCWTATLRSGSSSSSGAALASSKATGRAIVWLQTAAFRGGVHKGEISELPDERFSSERGKPRRWGPRRAVKQCAHLLHSLPLVKLASVGLGYPLEPGLLLCHGRNAFRVSITALLASTAV